MPSADPLPANELAKMLRALACSRDRVLLLLLLATGLRISEALSLRISHIYRDDHTAKDYLLVPREFTKGKLDARTCWLIPEIRNVLNHYIHCLDSYEPHMVIFPSQKGVNLAITPRHAARILLPAFQACIRTGHYTTHSPRKWFAQKMHAAMGRDLYATAAALGHRSPQSTTHYLSATQKRIRSAIQKALPEVFAESATWLPDAITEEAEQWKKKGTNYAQTK